MVIYNKAKRSTTSRQNAIKRNTKIHLWISIHEREELMVNLINSNLKSEQDYILILLRQKKMNKTNITKYGKSQQINSVGCEVQSSWCSLMIQRKVCLHLRSQRMSQARHQHKQGGNTAYFVDQCYMYFLQSYFVINISYILKHTILPTQIYLLKVNVIRHNFHTTPLEGP
jgi:hypothetical protein